MYSIRKYRVKDSEHLSQICIETASDIFRGKKFIEKALTEVYCRYYIEQEPETCFVLADENDIAKGYIFCAKNYDEYKRVFRKHYLKTWNIATLIMGNFAMNSIKNYAKDYPAHLHIDLLPECQRKGFGRGLIEALVEDLKARGIRGLMLHVSMDNKGARAFYEKCGFKILFQGKNDVLFGMKLDEF